MMSQDEDRVRRCLENINSPDDLKKLSNSQLAELAEELRNFIITNVSITGGHLAPSLGVVELTLALHYVFDSPRDKFIWDVGHQAYAHKILTGRRDRFHLNRQNQGLSGFPNRSESPHDAFGTGHASTSISAGYGMVCARDLSGEKFEVISIIGDGAMTGGLAFEGLNNAGSSGRKFIVVLNDNTMSISPNVGALSKYLAFLITDPRLNKIKKDLLERTLQLPQGSRIARSIGRLEASIKAMLVPGLFFEQMGFRYIGPLDGHKLDDLIHIFQQVKDLPPHPVLVHVLTRKGKGYLPAEQNPSKFHGIGAFVKETGQINGASKAPSYTSVFGKTIVKLAEKNPKIVAITAAMADGTGLSEFAIRFPERFYDVGIAEEHAVTFAAGMAAQGYRPVVAIYSTFMQRSIDQIIHDVALQNLPVVFALDRGGLVGEDGPTHHGCFDLSYLRQIPNLTILAPRDENDLQYMLFTALTDNRGPIALRYPRAEGVGCALDPEAVWTPIEIGRAEVARVGGGGVILTLGPLFHEAMQAAQILDGEGQPLTVVNMRSLKPLDLEILADLALRFDHIMTIEENALAGGFGSAVVEALSDLDINQPKVYRLGIPDRFIEQGERSSLLAMLKLDSSGIAQAAREFFPAAIKKNVFVGPTNTSLTHDSRHHRQHPKSADLGRSASVSGLARK
jgi:1-deoxy-D-xylulose-5-phosphate synthase